MNEISTYSKVSIIMPTYNRAHLIMETIQSIMDQTYTSWELIIMDDGSEDNTEDLIAQLKDNRIQFIKAGRTGLLSKIKNAAIRQAQAELIAFLDSDDLWEKTKLEKQVAVMKEYPDAGFCLTGGYTFVEKNKPIDYLYKQREGTRFDNFFIPMYGGEIGGYTPTLLFRKKAIDIAGYLDEIKFFPDPDFILSLACHFKGFIIFEPLLFRRLHDKNFSNKYWEEGYTEWVKTLRYYKKKVPPAIVKEALFKLYINYGESSLRYKQRGKAAKNFVRAWRYKPFSIVPAKKIAKAFLYFLKGK